MQIRGHISIPGGSTCIGYLRKIGSHTQRWY